MRKKLLEVAIDSTPVFGAGAVKDTFNLISDQIRRVLAEITMLKGGDGAALAKDNDLQRHFGSSFKGEAGIDWSDESQKRALVGELVADAKKAAELAQRAMLGHARGAEKTRQLREARDLLANLLLQDIDEDPDDGGGPGIKQGTAKDRVVSTTDPEMRHGHKSVSKGYQGYKAAVVADTADGVILATGVSRANEHDQECASRLIAEAEQSSEQKVERMLGDTAYGTMRLRAEMATAAVEVVAKMQPLSNAKGRFTVEDFRVDMRRGVVTCPNRKRSVRRTRCSDGWQYIFAKDDCDACPLRERCTGSKRSRAVRVADDYPERKRLRQLQRSARFQRIYRRRIMNEHRLRRLVQLGIRRARYLGKAKLAFQVAIAAAMANLTLAKAFNTRIRPTTFWEDRSLIPFRSPKSSPGGTVAPPLIQSLRSGGVIPEPSRPHL